MLVLSRRKEEAIIIAGNIRVLICDVQFGTTNSEGERFYCKATQLPKRLFDEDGKEYNLTGPRVRLGIEAPVEIRVDREEIFHERLRSGEAKPNSETQEVSDAC